VCFLLLLLLSSSLLLLLLLFEMNSRKPIKQEVGTYIYIHTYIHTCTWNIFMCFFITHTAAVHRPFYMTNIVLFFFSEKSNSVYALYIPIYLPYLFSAGYLVGHTRVHTTKSYVYHIL